MNLTLYTPGNTPALEFAKASLIRQGFRFSAVPHNGVTHLLLSIPSINDDGTLRGGQQLGPILEALPRSVTVIGGNLKHPALEGYQTIDLLQDPYYVAENASITAHCAIKTAMQALPVTLNGQAILVIGWGRIGKCLAELLKAMGSSVTVAARKETDRAMIRALGFGAVDYPLFPANYRVIFNTVPHTVLSREQTVLCRKECCMIDLASKLGVDAEKVIWARGLPGKDAPESSGELIAGTVIRLIQGKEQDL